MFQGLTDVDELADGECATGRAGGERILELRPRAADGDLLVEVICGAAGGDQLGVDLCGLLAMRGRA